MDKLNQKYQKLNQALGTLDRAIKTFTLFAQEGKGYNPHIDYDEEYVDYVIQWFTALNIV